MRIFLTFDYELYFGTKSGSVDKCMLEPTDRLLAIAQKHEAKMTFFIDCGHLVALKKYKEIYPSLTNDYNAIVNQLKKINVLGHDCALHIHPHWEDSGYDGESWKFNTRRYKLADFSEQEIESIFDRYSKALEEITGKGNQLYRAGGWCLQPFDKIKSAFKNHKISLDSSVFKKGYFLSDTHYFDFRKTPSSEFWKFSNDVCIEDPAGTFIELPITSYRYSPFFFWKLYLLGRLFPTLHKGIGNGKPIATKKLKRQYLTKPQDLPVSCDGYFASLLSSIHRSLVKTSNQTMVIIGHPKASTTYSLNTLDSFIKNKKKTNSFEALSKFL